MPASPRPSPISHLRLLQFHILTLRSFISFCTLFNMSLFSHLPFATKKVHFRSKKSKIDRISLRFATENVVYLFFAHLSQKGFLVNIYIDIDTTLFRTSNAKGDKYVGYGRNSKKLCASDFLGIVSPADYWCTRVKSNRSYDISPCECDSNSHNVGAQLGWIAFSDSPLPILLWQG